MPWMPALARGDVTDALEDLSSAVRTYADDNVDAANFGPCRGRRQTANRQMVRGDVAQFSRGLTEEVVMIVSIRVEVRTTGLDHRFAQQPGLRKLMQGVVHRGERHLNSGCHRFAMEVLGCDVTIPAFQEQPRQGEPLSCRAQTDGT